MPSSNPRTNGSAPPQGVRWPDAHLCPFWHSGSGSAEACVSAIPSSITWTQVSGLQPLVEPCLKQILKFLPRPDVWSALGPVPSACLLFLGAYYQAWSQQVSAACLSSFICILPTPPHPFSVGMGRHESMWYSEWKMEPRASHMLSSCFSTEPYPQFSLYLSLPTSVSQGSFREPC